MEASFKVSDAVVAKQLHTLKTDSTVHDALELLAKYSVSSAPVLDKDHFWGFVDYLDILAYLVDVVTKTQSSRVTPPSTSMHTDDVSMILQRSNEFQLRTVREKSLANRSHHDPAVRVSIEDPLSAATAHMIKGNVHRVAVTDKSGHLINILSQSDVLKFAFNDFEHRFNGQNLTAEHLMGSDPLFSVKESDITVDSFISLHDSHHSGAAIVNEDGQLVGCLSTTDLKGLNEKSFLMLLNNVGSWRKERSGKLHAVPRSLPMVGIVKRMVESRLHRIFVVDTMENMKPLGVITLKDVLKHMKH